MNEKKDILNAWILVEQLSEGSIKSNDKKLKSFADNNKGQFNEVFNELMELEKGKLNLTEKQFEKAGIVLYMGIFKFENVIEIMRKNNDTLKTHEESSKSYKFTWALYFDKNLNFIEDNFFYTISGYINKNKQLPDDFYEIEQDLKNKLASDFEYKQFNTVIYNLLLNNNVSLSSCKFKFIKDLTIEDMNLHSFFIDDLKKAKKISTSNLERYFSGFSGERKNLDSHLHSGNFNPSLLRNILQPKNYPLGRFPSNPNHSLAFMQEVTVNLAIHDENTIKSVNGPPGTGKTTLLKDIFADLIVEQSYIISGLFKKEIPRTINFYKNGKIGILPEDIAEKNIIVASSNNGAVQNIVNELPQNNQIDKCFFDSIKKTNYFRAIANTCIDDSWGLFSLQGGSSKNVDNLINTIKKINDLFIEENFEDNSNIYTEFISQYDNLVAEKLLIQKYSNISNEKNSIKENYQYKKQKQKNSINKFIMKQSEKIDTIQAGIKTLEKQKIHLENKQTTNSKNIEYNQRLYKTIELNKPRMFRIKKLMNTKDFQAYKTKFNLITDALNSSEKKSYEIYQESMRIKNALELETKKITNIKEQIKKKNNSYIEWVDSQKETINQMEKKLELVYSKLNDYQITDLDFSISYDELQKSNPWFTKQFRIKQSELFITALAVRKQFLYDNSKNLDHARKIWENRRGYESKKDGPEILSCAWQWINLAIPIISTTFASFGNMFKKIPKNSIGNLFIDEAGQALPQASVGAIFRSKKVMVVGDPSQIKPVLSLDSNMLNFITHLYQIDERYLSSESSTQTLIDETSQYGYLKKNGDWIGIPLWVHRRSNYPMFSISNAISYNNLMVQGKSEQESQGISYWYDCKGTANDKFVMEQAELLIEKISEKIKENNDIVNEIYVISPFKNVAYNLASELKKIKFTKEENNKVINVGTVHTFQGKEADIVYFVLGADKNSQGAASWAVSEPNIMNVAATRAKKEFYIIGDKELYSKLGSDTADKTISIITTYNK